MNSSMELIFLQFFLHQAIENSLEKLDLEWRLSFRWGEIIAEVERNETGDPIVNVILCRPG